MTIDWKAVFIGINPIALVGIIFVLAVIYATIAHIMGWTKPKKK